MQHVAGDIKVTFNYLTVKHTNTTLYIATMYLPEAWPLWMVTAPATGSVLALYTAPSAPIT